MNIVLRKCEDIKGVTRSRKSKDRQYNGQDEKYKWQTMLCQTLYRKIKIEQHKHNKKSGMNKMTNNALPNTIQENQDWATQTQQKFGDEHKCSGRVLRSSCSSGATRGNCCIF